MIPDISSNRNPFLPSDPIFILGILPRSGTNFLYDLLLLHPDCGALTPIWEDWLVYHADSLVKYAKSVYGRWDHWGTDPRLEDELCRSLGDGLISFLTGSCDSYCAPYLKSESAPAVEGDVPRAGKRRLVTKTPSVSNVRNFFKFFPRARLLLLVRDGRDVVESRIRSFSVSYELTARQWAAAADAILEFDRTYKHSGYKYAVVRYEDLWNKPEEELRRIFAFLDLDPGAYNFNAATNLPVRGSSVFGREQGDKVHWKPVEKTPDFNPLLRWSEWGRPSHERFNWIAGEYLDAFGYEQKQYGSKRFIWNVWNKVLDVTWPIRNSCRLLSYERLKKLLKRALGPEGKTKVRRALLMAHLSRGSKA